MSFSQSDVECVNNIRTLAADVVQKANSGHPGAPMGMAPMAHVLWDRVMNYSPTNPKWVNRDRFVLSNGHSCALLYIMLHLSGYKVSKQDLMKFRQLGSITPGHPESFMTEGIEVSTGPLGQGISNAVGLAIAQAQMAATFNKPGFTLFDNFTYVLLGDGCLQEGVASEACSLAGHLGLGKLICLYDDNKITIDGQTDLSFSEDVPLRFKAYGWHTITVEGGDSDLASILRAIEAAKAVTDKPSLISVKTTIGFGSKLQGTAKCHGSPLGDADIANVKKQLGFDPAVKFAVKNEVAGKYNLHKARGQGLVDAWNRQFAAYGRQYPSQAADLKRRLEGKLPAGWQNALPTWTSKDKADATRNLSGKVLNALAGVIPELTGGSADLTPSNKTGIKAWSDFQKKNPVGQYLRFGVREHGMAAIGNGLAAYGTLIPFTATFLNFIQYCFPAVRLAALSGHKQIFVMTHDSIGLGEDGPTHQPIEAVAHCRATPNLNTWRPSTGNETTAAYISAMEFNGPSVLCLSRQGMPHLDNSTVDKALKGGYVVQCGYVDPDVIFVATGSEVSLCIEAAKKMPHRKVRIVSMPCTELFDKQSVQYRRSVIKPGVPTIAVEMLGNYGWNTYSHQCIGMSTFGASAPIKALLQKFGFTPDQVAAKANQIVATLKSEAASMGAPGVAPLPTHYSNAPVLRAHL